MPTRITYKESMDIALKTSADKHPLFADHEDMTPIRYSQHLSTQGITNNIIKKPTQDCSENMEIITTPKKNQEKMTV